MVSHTTPARADEADGLLCDSWFDPIEHRLRAKVRGFIETMIVAAAKKPGTRNRATPCLGGRGRPIQLRGCAAE